MISLAKKKKIQCASWKLTFPIRSYDQLKVVKINVLG